MVALRGGEPWRSQVNDEIEFGRLLHGEGRQALRAQPKSCIAYSKTPHHGALTLGVVKTNPALGLYERLAFRITHEDERKFYMRHDCRVAVASASCQPLRLAPAARCKIHSVYPFGCERPVKIRSLAVLKATPSQLGAMGR